MNVPIFFYLDNADTPPRIIIEGFTSLFNSLHTTLAVPERLTRILSWSELHSMTFLWLIFVTSMFISFSCNYDGIFIRRWLFAIMIFMTCTNLRCKSTQILSYKHQNHQKIIQYSDNQQLYTPFSTISGAKLRNAAKVMQTESNNKLVWILPRCSLPYLKLHPILRTAEYGL